MANGIDVATTQTNPATSLIATSIEQHDLAWIVSRRDRCDPEANVFDEEARHRVEIGALQHRFDRRGIRVVHAARSTSTGPARRNEPPLSTINR
jgi:hypothetical protein